MESGNLRLVICIQLALLLVAQINARGVGTPADAPADAAAASAEAAVEAAAQADAGMACEDIGQQFSSCFADYGYTQTSLPNAFGQTNIRFARIDARTFTDIYNNSNCASQHELQEFICVSFFPPCVGTTEYPGLKGCQPWCESLRSRCEAELTGSGLTWPSCTPTGDNCWRFAGGDSDEDSSSLSSSISVESPESEGDDSAAGARQIYDALNAMMSIRTDADCLTGECVTDEPQKEANSGEQAQAGVIPDDPVASTPTVTEPAEDARRQQRASNAKASSRQIRAVQGGYTGNLRRNMYRMRHHSCESSDSGDCNHYEPPTAAPAGNLATTTDVGGDSNEATTTAANSGA